MTSDTTPQGPLLFFSAAQARTMDALVDQIIPSEDGSPGAAEAGVTHYIDRALAGFLRDLRPTYRSGLGALQVVCMQVMGGEVPFADLETEGRRKVVEELDALRHEDPGNFAGQFFRIVREHTIQGLFCDPEYGGNRGLIGWKLIGYPGAQWGYHPDQMRPGVDATAILICTLDDLYARRKGSS